MNILTKTLLNFIFLVYVFNLNHAQDEPVNNELDSECKIPNQSKTKGVCVQRINCAEYENLFNETELTVERLSFIINLNCGFDYDIWKSLVCCPLAGNSYKYV